MARGRMALQGGLLTRHDALDCGLSPSMISKLIRDREWIIIRRGVYADADAWAALDPYRGRPRLQSRAAMLTMQRGWVLSHDSAAHEWGMNILVPEQPHVHITRPGFTTAWSRAGVKHHYAHFQPAQRVMLDDIPVLDIARTAVDIGREHGEEAGEVACDSALHLGVPRGALVEAYGSMTCWPGITGARRAVHQADARAENPAETLGRRLVRELNLGEPDVQFPVRISTGTAWCDLRIGNHVFEIDGRVKYRSAEHGGVATREIEEVLWAEKQRERLVCAEGLGVSRIFWADYWGSRRAEALLRLRRDYFVTEDRFGPELNPILAQSAALIRSQQGWRDGKANRRGA